MTKKLFNIDVKLAEGQLDIPVNDGITGPDQSDPNRSACGSQSIFALFDRFAFVTTELLQCRNHIAECVHGVRLGGSKISEDIIEPSAEMKGACPLLTQSRSRELTRSSQRASKISSL